MTSYIDPSTVKSPQWAKIKIEEIIIDTGRLGYSVAKLWYEDELRIGIRWNGGDKDKGMPSSRGNPTWFIMPEDFNEITESTSRMLIPNKVNKVASYIRNAVHENKGSDKSDHMVSVPLDISLSETEKNQLKQELAKENIYFPSSEMCGGDYTNDGKVNYTVFYITN